jgi:hypothetical protein
MVGRRPASRREVVAIAVRGVAEAGVTRATARMLIAGLAIAGCAGRGVAAPATVTVYQTRGAIQCGDRGVPPTAMARSLTDAGVAVLRLACGHDGLMRATVCGAPTGEINIFEIAASDLAAAERLGFRALGTLPQAREGRCRS